jgi:hypothetical protein
MKMRRSFNKGDVIIIFKNGIQTKQSTNLDINRELGAGDIFEWNPTGKMEPTKMKVLSVRFPIEVEIVD